MPKLTANKGASIERALIVRKIKSLQSRLSIHAAGINSALDDLDEYIEGMAGRASSKKGGLGRK